MSFPRYPEYKETNVERLGSIPSHWQLLPCRAIVDECMDKNTDARIQDYLSLMANVGVIRYEDKGDVGNKKPDDLSKCKIVRPGNLVINSMNYGIGSYGLSTYAGVCSPVYIVLDPFPRVIETRYALRIFEEKQFQSWAQSFGNGILAHRSAIGWDDLKNIKIGLPPLEEQSLLSRFLDHETAKIDALIREQERLIELLQEKRQAVISHAMTKGLDPDVPMKDSGVEWLGEVPAHWEVKQLKHVIASGSSITYGIVQAGPNYEGGVPYIRTSDMSKDSLPESGYPTTSPAIDQSYARSRVAPGDLVISIRASVGKCLAVPDGLKYANLTQGTAKVSPGKKVDRDFLSAFINSAPTQSYFDLHAKGATFKEITLEVLRRTPVLVPPLDEQVYINNSLSENLEAMQTIIDVARRSIPLLIERRSALISAAVTGKIDVRSWQPPGDESAYDEEVRQFGSEATA